MSSTLSAVTGRPLAASTIAGYGADWALFTDWCAATGHPALPTDAATISAFHHACPAAPGTQRRRVAAIEHHHRAAGADMPWKPTGDAAPPVRVRQPLDAELVATAMRLLPSRGWTAGLFGRRDKALLPLAASTDLPYRELALMTVGQLDIVDGAAGITDTTGQTHLIEATTDPVLCGPCALVRWRRVVDAQAVGTSAAQMRDLFKNAPMITPDSPHACNAPKPVSTRTLAVPLFPPINQWGHLPLPVRPLTRHAVSVLARQVETELPVHRDLGGGTTDRPNRAEPQSQEPAAVRPVYDWAAANQRKKEAVAALASLSATMDDIDTRIKNLIARTRNLDFE